MLSGTYRITLVFVILSFLFEWLVPEFQGKVFFIDLLGFILAFFVVKDLKSSFKLLKFKKSVQFLRYFFAFFILFFLLLRFYPLVSLNFLREGLWERTYFHAALFISLIYSFLPSRHFLKFLLRFEVTPGRFAVISFTTLLLSASFALIMPFSLNIGMRLKLIDAFFISTSALTVTGLSPINIPQTFNFFGQAIILILIQIGALGVISFSFILAFFTQKRLSMSGTLMGQQAYNVQHIGDIYPFLKKVVFSTFFIEILGALFIYFLLPENTPHRVFSALFHSISAFCNAGFSIFPNGLNFPGFYLFKFIIAVLIILGGIGFPVIFEFYNRRIIKKARSRKRASPYFLMTTRIYFALILLGFIGIFFTQIGSALPEQGDLFARIFNAFFHSVSSRTAGFNALPIELYPHTTLLLIISLMIIGGASVSPAGGIKVSTLGIILACAWSMFKGRKWVQYEASEISLDHLQKAVTVVVVYFMLAFFGVLSLLIIENKEAWALTFEVFSALSTVGLSLGVTEGLSTLSKLILMILMICGRLGILLLLSLSVENIMEQRFRYPKERYFIG